MSGNFQNLYFEFCGYFHESKGVHVDHEEGAKYNY